MVTVWQDGAGHSLDALADLFDITIGVLDPVALFGFVVTVGGAHWSSVVKTLNKTEAVVLGEFTLAGQRSTVQTETCG